MQFSSEPKGVSGVLLPDLLTNCEFVALDTETTGKSEGAEVVEVAALRFRGDCVVDRYVSLVRPTGPVLPTASAVHGLHFDDLQDAPPRTVVDAWLTDFVKPDDLIVAHYAQFDRDKVPVLADRRWACTYRLSMHLWPEADSHSCGALASWLRLDRKMPKDGRPHRAKHDAMACGLLFHRQLIAFQGLHPYASLDDVVAFTASPIDVKIMPCGKYAGKPIAEIDTRYLEFVLSDAQASGSARYFKNIDADTLLSIKKAVQLRLRNVA